MPSSPTYRVQFCMPREQHAQLKRALFARAIKSRRARKAPTASVSGWIQEEAAKLIAKYPS